MLRLVQCTDHHLDQLGDEWLDYQVMDDRELPEQAHGLDVFWGLMSKLKLTEFPGGGPPSAWGQAPLTLSPCVPSARQLGFTQLPPAVRISIPKC